MNNQVKSLLLILFCAVGLGRLSAADTTAVIDANRITMIAANDGILANNFYPAIANRYAGLFYGDGDSLAILYGSSLWIAGKVRGEVRNSMAYNKVTNLYTDFSPGVYQSQESDSLRFRVYKITRQDLVAPGQDYISWPTDLGAPVDDMGRPLLRGDQTLFSVYNDADMSRRDADSSPEPLFANVRQLVYAWDKERFLGDIVFAEFEIENVLGSALDSLFVGLYSDPDLGLPRNDLLGSDSALALIYVYSKDYDDQFEEYGFPVLGIAVMKLEKSRSDSYRQSVTATALDYNTFPNNSPQAFNRLKGLQLSGAPYIDPFTSLPTKFEFTGDPRYDVGWLDETPADKACLISAGPFRLLPQEKIKVVVAYLVAVGENRREAIANLFAMTLKARDWINWGTSGLELSVGGSGHITDIAFEPAWENWMLPVSFVGDFGGSGIGKARDFIGSTLPDTKLFSAQVNFSDTFLQKAYYYDFQNGDWQYMGFLPLPVSAIRSDRQTPMELIFLTENGDLCDNCFLYSGRDPDAGYRLLITATKYDGVEKNKYILSNPVAQLPALDLAYLIQFGVKPFSQVFNLRDGQKLLIEYSADSAADILTCDSIPTGAVGMEMIFASSLYSSTYDYELKFTEPDDFSPVRSLLSVPTETPVPLYIRYHPIVSGPKICQIHCYNRDFEEFQLSPGILFLRGRAFPWPVEGDINLNGWLEIGDIAAYLGYLYRDYPLPQAELDLDLDDSGKIELADVVRLINLLFFSASF